MSDSRLYRIRHRTTYRYSGRIDLCHSLAHLAPREENGQETVSHKLRITPTPDYEATHRDYLGNTTHYFSIQTSHKSLEVLSELVARRPGGLPKLPEGGVAWDALSIDGADTDSGGVPLGHFLLPTKACPNLESTRESIRPFLGEGRDVMDIVSAFMSWVHEDFTYHPGVTSISTPLGIVMEKKAGVCQDFAHVMIASLRSAGIPTRYVSGYLETIPPPGREKLRGADASHAWIEAWAPSSGWVGFDPTNNCLPGPQHIKVCHGRDYFEVQPIRGIFLGSGSQALSVEVDVEPIDEPDNPGREEADSTNSQDR